MTKSTITRERLEKIKSWRETYGAGSNVMLPAEEAEELARMMLAAMESEPVELPLDYLQGHKDGLEWAAQLAKANHPETGDWLYDDPIELAKAISKGPDMPPSQPALDTEPVAYTDERNLGYIDRGRETAYLWGKQNSEAGDVPLYRHAQQPVVPPKQHWEELCRKYPDMSIGDAIIRAAWWNHCRAAMLNHPSRIQPNTDAAPGTEIKHPSSNSPVIPDGYVMVPKEPTKEMIDAGWLHFMGTKNPSSKGTYKAMLAAAPQEVKGE